MNNDRGQSLHISSITPLKENNIYVATLHSVIQTDFSSEVKHQFIYKIKVDNQIVYTNHNISTQASTNQVCQSMIGLNVIVTIAWITKRMNLTLTESI